MSLITNLLAGWGHVCVAVMLSLGPLKWGGSRSTFQHRQPGPSRDTVALRVAGPCLSRDCHRVPWLRELWGDRTWPLGLTLEDPQSPSSLPDRSLWVLHP